MPRFSATASERFLLSPERIPILLIPNFFSPIMNSETESRSSSFSEIIPIISSDVAKIRGKLPDSSDFLIKF